MELPVKIRERMIISSPLPPLESLSYFDLLPRHDLILVLNEIFFYSFACNCKLEKTRRVLHRHAGLFEWLHYVSFCHYRGILFLPGAWGSFFLPRNVGVFCFWCLFGAVVAWTFCFDRHQLFELEIVTLNCHFFQFMVECMKAGPSIN